MTPDEVVAVVQKLSKTLKYKFRFPGFESEDIEQEIYRIVAAALPKYTKEKGPLENYLRVVVQNRLKSLKRDRVRRIDEPCFKCPLWNSKQKACSRFEDRMNCDIFRPWELAYQIKENLVRPINLDEVNDERESRMREENTPEEAAIKAEMTELIDRELPQRHRRTYLLFMGGQRVGQAACEEMLAAVRQILVRGGYGPDSGPGNGPDSGPNDGPDSGPNDGPEGDCRG